MKSNTYWEHTWLTAEDVDTALTQLPVSKLVSEVLSKQKQIMSKTTK